MSQRPVDQLLTEAIAVPPGRQRDRWIREVCEDDTELEGQLRDLAAAHEGAGSFMAGPRVEHPHAATADQVLPRDLGAFRIEAEIGRGGMGVVYRATDTRLDRTVAIKALPPLWANDPGRMARLEREAKILASLNHTNIAAIHGLEQHDDRTFLILEFIEGQTLEDRLREGPLTVDETRSICSQVAAALAVAHDAGVVHRDLKPANIKIRADGTVKVLDFGLATSNGHVPAEPRADIHDASAMSGRSDHTTLGTILGTAAYMSPEQARGRSLDRRADIWSFGAILYECLTGASCFRSDTVADTIEAVLKRPIDLDGLPADTTPLMRHLLRRSLERNAGKRLRDMHDVHLALEHDSSGTDVATGPRLRDRRRTRRVTSWLAGLAIVVAVVVVAISINRRPPGPAAARGTGAPRAFHLAIPVSLPEAGSFWGGRKIVALHSAPDGSTSSQSLLWGDRFVAAAISPDGRTIAYVGVDPTDTSPRDPAGIYVRSLDSAEVRRLPGTENAARLSFSPDGAQLAFVSWERGSRNVSVRRVPVDGGPVTTVLEDPHGSRYYQYSSPRWLSDSELLHVSRSPLALLRVPLEPGEPTTVAKLVPFEDGEQWLGAYDPVVSPDGRSVLLTVIRDAPAGLIKTLCRVALDSGTVTPVLDDAEYGIIVPTGHLVFVRRGSLCAAPIDPETLRINGPAVSLIAGMAKGPITCSRDGTLVSARDATNDLLRPIVTIDRRGRREALRGLTGPFQGAIFVAPDGRQLAVNVIGSRGAQAHVIDLDQSRLRPITGEESQATFDTRWMPDGRVVYHSADAANARIDVAVAGDESNTEVQALFDRKERTGSIHAEAFTPDGRYMIFHAGPPDGVKGIYAMELGARREAVLIAPARSTANPALSPDGKWLAYTKRGADSSEVLIRLFDPANPASAVDRRASGPGGRDPFWSADGTELFFIDERAGHIMGVRFDADTEPSISKPEKLVDTRQMNKLKTASTGDREVDVLPDGRFVYVGQPVERMPSSLEVVTNWFEELKARMPATAAAR